MGQDRHKKPEPPVGSRRRVAVSLLTLAALAVLLPVLVGTLGGAGRLRGLVGEAGTWAPLVYVALKAATSVVAPLAGTPLKAASGTLFGLWEGIVYSVLGDVIGGCACFWLSRALGRRVVARLLDGERLDRIDGLAQNLGGWRALLFARLVLASVYNLASFAAGLTRLPFRQYLAVTVLGGIIHTGFLVSLGASATLDRNTLLVAYAGLAALAFLALLGRRRLRRFLGEPLNTNQPDEAVGRSPEPRRETQE